ncbi:MULTISPECIES: glycosyltransferase [Aerococcus]|uniref:glycosyltransferase n=1 Tax=Aerococcus TaxID=1375 RepID=UPI000DCDB78E|nr:glycosyltransferase [Aerococcus urinae]MDK7303538.1 glycosyltransferase [Aerococcus urinae]RAV71603.1 glycosyltransferase family 8 protein [Aerococcus urinae]RAW04989.1 glycosyltransferase family 8 protein [Aerococcus urinae]
MYKKVIALAADNPYAEYVMTTIKSIVMHNSEISFYILNRDIPMEYFKALNKRLRNFDCEIIDCKISNNEIDNFDTFLNYSAYLRYFIPEVILADRVLYLDCDLIVTGDISELFSIDFKGQPLLAVPDPAYLKTDREYGQFNSGVMVFNCNYWRENRLTQKFIELARKIHDKVPNADQSIVNELIGDNYKRLSRFYNYTISLDVFARYSDYANGGWYEDLSNRVPTILHYTMSKKPWHEHTVYRFRNLWWYYWSLDWSEIKAYKYANTVTPDNFMDICKYHAFILTNSGDIENIEYLIQSLPNIQFHIAAYTLFSDNIMALTRYSNVMVYPEILDAQIQDLINKADIYLDINHANEVNNILTKISDHKIPIFSFRNTVHQINLVPENHLFSSNKPERMVEAIQNYLKEK